MVLEEALVEAAGTDHLALLALADEHEDAGQSNMAQIRRLQYRLRNEADTLSDQERKPLEAELVRLSRDCPPPVHEVVNSIGMRLAQIPAGLGWIGSPEDEPGRYDDEGPRHQVRFDSFFLGVFQVTQEQYQEVMGSNPSHFKGDNLPVETVSWHDAVEFCRRLSALPEEKAAGRVYRLPHEKEWEYACRGNIDCHPYAFGDTLTPEMANFDGVNKGTTPVGSYKPNTFGLYDMHGNVWEWCANAYTSRYEEASEEGPFVSSGVGPGLPEASTINPPAATETNRPGAAVWTASASSTVSEDEQSNPFGCSEVVDGSTATDTVDQPSGMMAIASPEVSTTAFASASEGEQSDPFISVGQLEEVAGDFSTEGVGQPFAGGSIYMNNSGISDFASVQVQESEVNSYRVNRGGCWSNRGQICRSAFRGDYSPGGRYFLLGFRVALVPLSFYS